MKGDVKNHAYITDRMVLIGFVLAAFYWIIESFLSIFLSYEFNFFQKLLESDISEIWTRLIVLCLFIIFGSHAQFTIDNRKKEAATRERFQRLLSPDLAEMVVSGQLKVEKGGEDRIATVLFIDIRGFAAMSENTQAAEMLKMLNEYFEIIVEVVFRHEGTVDKFIGDEMMVIWGAPIANEDDAARAVYAALDMQSVLIEFNKTRVAKGEQQIEVGIGINTGNLVAGYIGSTRTMSYSVIGDSVNTASRLCSEAEPGQIIISENTYNHVRDLFETVELEPFQAKGKFKPIRAFNVIGKKRFNSPT